MSKRSTRNKLRWQALQAIEAMNVACEHLALLDELAAGRSPYIEKHLATIVLGAVTVKESLESFREGL